MLISGNEVKLMRLKMGLSQEQFCQYTDYTRQTINRIERGVCPVTVQSEKVFLLAFSRWSGAFKYGVSITTEGVIREGIKRLLVA